MKPATFLNSNYQSMIPIIGISEGEMPMAGCEHPLSTAAMFWGDVRIDYAVLTS
jgi:hypothetical protein